MWVAEKVWFIANLPAADGQVNEVNNTQNPTKVCEQLLTARTKSRTLPSDFSILCNRTGTGNAGSRIQLKPPAR